MNVVYLGGGVGGAKLLYGLYHVHDRSCLTAVINTGDDFEHWGLWISPDLDTCMYTLAQLGDQERGWGLQNETYTTYKQMCTLGQPDWFLLGDRDLATHLRRTNELRNGHTLTTVTAGLTSDLNIDCALLPMTDEPRQTFIDSKELGVLGFQQWLVRHRAQPLAQSVEYRGTQTPSEQVHNAIKHADLIVIGPSNPYVSILPIVSMTGIRDLLQTKTVVSVSPIVNGQAVKGPLARMLQSIDQQPSEANSILQMYRDFVDLFIVQTGDGVGCSAKDVEVYETETVLKENRTRLQLARIILEQAS